MIARLMQFWDEERSLTALLILLIVEMFILIPSSRIGFVLEVLGSLLFSLLLLAGLLTMARHRAFQFISGGFFVITVVVRISRTAFGVSSLLPWDALCTILSVVAMLIVVLWQVYREGPVTGHRVRGAIAAYLLIAVVFAHVYMLISVMAEGSFQIPAWAQEAHRSETFIYFSIVTLTTVGFGDVTAIHPLARSFVMLEALIGQLYPAILLARLVTLELETRRSGKGK